MRQGMKTGDSQQRALITVLFTPRKDQEKINTLMPSPEPGQAPVFVDLFLHDSADRDAPIRLWALISVWI